MLYGLSLLLREDYVLSLSFSEGALQRRETAFLCVVVAAAAPTLCHVITRYSAVAPMVTLMWIIYSGKSPLQLPQEPPTPKHQTPTTTNRHPLPPP